MNTGLENTTRWSVVLERPVSEGDWKTIENLLPEVLKWAESSGHRALCFQIQSLCVDLQKRRGIREMESGQTDLSARSSWLLEDLLKQLSHVEWLGQEEDAGSRQDRSSRFGLGLEVSESDWIFDMDLEIRPTLKGAI